MGLSATRLQNRSAAAAYGRQAGNVTPAKAVDALYTRLLADMDAAKRAAEAPQPPGWREQVHNHLTHARDVLLGLRMVLDFEQGADVATALEDAYAFCDQRLVAADMTKDTSLCEPAVTVVTGLQTAWRAAMQETGTL